MEGVDQINNVLARGLGWFDEDTRHEKADKILFDKRSMAGTMWHWHRCSLDIVSQLKPCSKYEVLTKSLSLSDGAHLRESAAAVSFHPHCRWFVWATFTCWHRRSHLLSSPPPSCPSLSPPSRLQPSPPLPTSLLFFPSSTLPWSAAPHLLWGLTG